MSIWMKIFRYATGLAVLGLFLGLLGCGSTAADYFAYAEAPFTAAVEGIVDGERVVVQLYYHGERNAEGEEPAPLLTVSYRAPESLKGLTVTLYEDGSTDARLGDRRKQGDFSHVIAPFRAFLYCGDYDSIHQEGERTSLTVKALTYRFESGVLQGVAGDIYGRQLDLVVTSLKQLK